MPELRVDRLPRYKPRSHRKLLAMALLTLIHGQMTLLSEIGATDAVGAIFTMGLLGTFLWALQSEAWIAVCGGMDLLYQLLGVTEDVPMPDLATAAACSIHRAHLDAFAAQLDAVVDEAKLRFEADGLHSRAVDAANVAMTDVTIAPEAFQSYSGDDTVIGLDVDGLRDVLDHDADVTAEFAVRPDERRFDLRLGDADFSMASIDPSSVRREPDIPDLDLGTEVIMEARRLAEIVAYADAVSDRVIFGFDHDDCAFYAEAEGDTDDLDYRVHGRDLVDTSSSGDAHSNFALGYLKIVLDAIPERTKVSLSIDEEYPMRLEYDFGPDDGGHVTYVLAPRIESGGS